jgi:hypothetical protein
MLNTLIYILVVGVVIGIIWWVADYLPVPEPLNKILKVVSVVIGCIIVIYALLGMTGTVSPLSLR